MIITYGRSCDKILHVCTGTCLPMFFPLLYFPDQQKIHLKKTVAFGYPILRMLSSSDSWFPSILFNHLSSRTVGVSTVYLSSYSLAGSGPGVKNKAQMAKTKFCIIFVHVFIAEEETETETGSVRNHNIWNMPTPDPVWSKSKQILSKIRKIWIINLHVDPIRRYASAKFET
jgi:hypothetical protein